MIDEDYDFTEVDRFDGQIRGELANDGGVVTTPDKNWEEIQEGELRGNWEEITSSILIKSLDSPDQQQTNRLSLDEERVVDILSNSDIINADHKTESRLQASLLLEYLVSEGVYKRDGDEIVVLEELSVDSDLKTQMNWCAFFSTTRKKIQNSVKIAEDRAEKIADMISTGEEMRPEVEESTEELLEDLNRITDGEWEPQGYDKDNLPIPPEGVDDEDKYEYMELIGELNAKNTVNIRVDPNNNGGRTIEPEDARKRLNVKVKQLKRHVDELEKGEVQLRNNSIIDIADIPGVMQTLNSVMNLAPAMFNGNPVGEEDPEEVSEGIRQLAREKGVDLDSDEEEIEEEPAGLVDEETEEAVSDETEEESSGVLFDDEAQHD